MRAKILITGASGLLGRSVLNYFENTKSNDFEWLCLGLCRSRTKDNLKSCDITDPEQINNVVNDFKPDVLIHCAAERKVEAVENNFDGTVKLNVSSTKNLAEISAKLGIFFIYISTDYVFDGKNPPYKPEDKPNPLNKYGTTKLEGEIVTQNASQDNCIVRVPILYSDDIETVNESAVTAIFETVKKIDSISKIDNAQIRYPLHTIDVARFLYKLTEKRLQGSKQIKGIFHCSGSEKSTKYEIACIMADLFNLPKSHLIPDLSALNALPQLRPIDAHLDTTSSYKILDNFNTIIDFKDSLKKALERFV